MNKTNVLFVCLGNICRSPSAEAAFQKLIDEKKLSNEFKVDSAGTIGKHAGESADPRTKKMGESRGLNITSISRQFVAEDFKIFDYIVVMDDSNLTDVLKLDTKNIYKSKVSKMTDYCSDQFSEYSKVPDPYWGGVDGFSLVVDLLEDSSKGLFKHIQS